MSTDDDNRLTTKLWLDAHLRQFTARGQAFTIAHRGDDQRGSVILKIFRGRSEGCTILSRAYGPEGEIGWLPALDGRAVPEPEADDYLARLIARDPDVWVIEIESRDGSYPFSGKVL